MRYTFHDGVAMFETLLRLLGDLPDWEVYREVATVLDDEELVAWRRLYESRPGRDVLLREAVRVLSEQSRRRYPEIVGNPHRVDQPTGTGRNG
jgi:hypothetical protein